MANFLAVYGTSHGHTAKVVGRIAHVLTGHGHQVTVRRANELGGLSLDRFDGFLVAGSVIYGKHQSYLRDFVRENVRRFNAFPSAFVSVCGALMGTWAQGPAEAAKYTGAFLNATGWQPRLRLSIAGNLPYTKYGLMTRLLMRVVSKRTDRPTDTSRDWEFTDWNAVDLFAQELAGLIVKEEARVETARA